jgi:hypothetical protein
MPRSLLRSHFFVGVFSLPGYAQFRWKTVRRALAAVIARLILDKT